MQVRHWVIPVVVIALCVGIADADAKSQRAQYYKGLNLYNEGQYAEAIEAFKEQLRETPQDQAVIRWLGLAKKRLAQEASSSPTPQPVATVPQRKPATPVATSPEPSQPVTQPLPDKTPHTSLTEPSSVQDDYEQGISAYMNKDYRRAKDAFERYLNANPGHSASQQWLSMIQTLIANNPQAALPKYDSSSALPESEAAYTPPSETYDPPASNTFTPTRSQTNDRLIIEKDAQILQLKKKLAKAEMLAKRAIRQTKKALEVSQAQTSASAPTQVSHEEIATLKSSQTRLYAELDEKEKNLFELRKQFDQSRARIRELEREASSVSANRGTLAKAKDLQLQLASAEDDVMRFKQENIGLKRSLETLQGELSQLQNHYDATELARQTAEERLSEAFQDKQTFQKKLRSYDGVDIRVNDLEKQVADLKRQENSLKAEVITLRKKREMFADEVRVKESALESMHDNLEKTRFALERQRMQAQTDLSKLNHLLEESRGQGVRLATNLQQELKTRADLEAQVTDYERKHAEVMHQYALLKKQLNQMLPELERMRGLLNQFSQESNPRS